MLYPLKFKPNLKQFIWGGEKIAPYKGITSNQDHIGESWEVSAYKGLESVVASGALEGKTLPELVREYKGALVGEHVYERFSDEFPILIKFIGEETFLQGKDRNVVCCRCRAGSENP